MTEGLPSGRIFPQTTHENSTVLPASVIAAQICVDICFLSH